MERWKPIANAGYCTSFVKVVLTIVVAALSADRVLAQIPSSTFEVAVIKPSNPNSTAIRRGDCKGIDNQVNWGIPLGRCMYTRLTLRELLFFAYYAPLLGQYPVDQLVTGGPGWTGADHFDVEGKAEDPARWTHDELLRMFQSLLSERFKLQIHRETKEFSGYVLVQAKNGSKLVQTPEGTARQGLSSDGSGALGSVNGKGIQSADIAGFLSSRVRAPVIDRTNLTGRYDIHLTWNRSENVGGSASQEIGDVASILTAIQEQFGLKLEPQKVPTEIMVIDYAEKLRQH